MTMPYRKLLLPLDGSPLAEHVLPHLAWLAAPAATEIVLVRAVEMGYTAMAGSEYAWADILAILRKDAEEYLAAQKSMLEQAGYRVKTKAVEGDPAQVILELAESSGADCIAMCSHGRSGLARWALGSVAERVIQGTQIPVLLVRASTPPRHAKIQTILLPLDGSTVAEQAVPVAQALAQANDARVLLFQVIQKMDESTQQIFFKEEAAAKTIFAKWRLHAEQYLASLARRLEEAGVASDYRVVVDNPDRAICAMTKGPHVDLVVMGTHGRSGIRRWVYGSVANQVLRGADCPLLLVRTGPAA
ncbi:MAG: universal stress protein [Caldilineaceae bacterium]|nr:universal stress protein [Caldilineaceae bacterium]